MEQLDPFTYITFASELEQPARPHYAEERDELCPWVMQEEGEA